MTPADDRQQKNPYQPSSLPIKNKTTTGAHFPATFPAMAGGDDNDKTKPERPLPDPALKWGVTPRDNSNSNNDENMNKNKSPEKATAAAAGETSDWENYYDEATKAKLRAKGVNPALKAEMEHGQRQHCREGSFWAKVAATSFGGGWIK